MYTRLKTLRKNLHLSQDVVAKKLNIPRTALVAIESNKRKISAEELKNFSELYNVSLDEIMYGISNKTNETTIANLIKKFSALSDSDQNEIIDFINFKSNCQTHKL